MIYYSHSLLNTSKAEGYRWDFHLQAVKLNITKCNVPTLLNEISEYTCASKVKLAPRKLLLVQAYKVKYLSKRIRDTQILVGQFSKFQKPHFENEAKCKMFLVTLTYQRNLRRSSVHQVTKST